MEGSIGNEQENILYQATSLMEESIIKKPFISRKEIEPANRISIRHCMSLTIGFIIIGIIAATKKPDMKIYSAETFDVESATFGADFYTEIYQANDTIVNELNQINDGVETLSASMKSMAEVIYFAAGMIIIAIGLGMNAISCNSIKKRN